MSEGINNKSGKSNHLMAVLSVWGIIWVVLGHSGFQENLILTKLSGLHSWIYSFHMPLFFFISGFLFSLTNQKINNACSWRFVWKKTKRLMIPYFVLGGVIFAIKYFFAGLSHANREFTLGNFFKMFVVPEAQYSTIGHLWYIFTLYFIFLLILGLICTKILSKNKINLWTVILGLWLICYIMPDVEVFNLTNLVFFAPFFVTGILLQRHYDDYKGLFTPDKNGCWKVLVYFALTIGLVLVPSRLFPLRIIRAFCGILFSLSVCELIVYDCPRLKNEMVELSYKIYSIYLLSWFGQYIVKYILVNVMNCHYIVVVAGMFIGGFIVPLIACKVVDKVPVLNKKSIRLIIGY